ncbi:MAG: C4-type zinc ribbon domain-containing protein [Prevotella sp.]|nr:C4-type zinc ribbon domain-containing protein [Bacteroides sp.]MCM1366328.1 C4-type zinc ribbon domain-containing protein [Prevotella sp.]MCM1437132.1 C4-type zinc ribbon domain-containing protein [Prevotella sp.]
MATDKKPEKERSIEERLKALYTLQSYLSDIDRIKFLRGELPHEVKDLEDEIIRFQTRIAKHEDEIHELNDLINRKIGEIEDHRAKIAKYEDQINNVRNNREYAFLEKEKEFESLEIELAEKNIRDAKAKIERKTEEINSAREEKADNEHILDEKKAELNDIVSETREQEEAIMEKAKALEPLIDERTLKAFKRIRKNARNGLGIVTVQRNACGGCFNRIPPQRQLEIQMHKKVIVCEYCGRIMIDAKLAGIEEPEKEETTKRRSSRSKKTADKK